MVISFFMNFVILWINLIILFNDGNYIEIGGFMTISQAVVTKILNICKERNITINKLANICGITQSTLDNIVNGNSKNPTLLTIVRICDGIGITMKEFFSDPLFLDIDRQD